MVLICWGGAVESDAALPGLVIHEEGVELGNVHHDSVSLVQVDIFQMVLITLVLGEINKYLGGKKAKREKIIMCLNYQMLQLKVILRPLGTSAYLV